MSGEAIRRRGSATRLFCSPIVGRLKDKTYTVGGASFEITQHGFGRDLEWGAEAGERHLCGIYAHAERVYQKNVSVGLHLYASLHARRRLALKEHITRNDSSSTMYYEIGGHDAYTLCWQKDEKITDYFVEFEGTDALTRIVTDESVMLTAERSRLPPRRRQAAYFA